jgi:uridine kinase
MKSKLIGIAGGSCSGKTTLARAILDSLGTDVCHILFQDNYYIDQSKKFDGDGGSVNFDHPNSLDWKLLELHLKSLKDNQRIDVPQYDFVKHSRKEETISFDPIKFILIDGTLIFHHSYIRDLFDYKIYLEADYETRFGRRLLRDMRERGRTEKGVKKQFESQVEPMHIKYVTPSKRFADLLLTQEDLNSDRIKFVEKKIISKCN